MNDKTMLSSNLKYENEENLNMRKLLILFMFMLVASLSFAGSPVQFVGGGGSTGNTTVELSTASMILPNPLVTQDKIGRVESSNFYNVNLATNSVTLLSSVVTLTVPCEIVFGAKGALWIGPATSTVATVQSMEKYADGDKWSIKVSTTTYDIGMAAATTATCPISITVHNLAQ